MNEKKINKHIKNFLKNCEGDTKEEKKYWNIYIKNIKTLFNFINENKNIDLNDKIIIYKLLKKILNKAINGAYKGYNGYDAIKLIYYFI